MPQAVTLCPVKLLIPRTLIALTGAALIAVAYGVDSRAVALAGGCALLLAETLALAGLVSEHESPAQRALLGVCEAAAGLAISLLEPAAMLVALAQIVYSVIASGMATVSASLGKPLAKPRSEAMRRLLGVAANAGLCLIALRAAGVLSPEGAFDLRPRNVGVLDTWRNLGLGPHNLALLCMALVTVASARTITELAMSAKWTK